jgi:hypothetical protein
MSIAELMPALRDLPRSEKFRLVQLLVAELAREDMASILGGETTWPIWTPPPAVEAAEGLLRALEEGRAKG